ncbi:MAG TPA: hypothetical protein VGP46_12240 [Acidimicrobiales bacterium]|nr:hypothetical protein [Acidimicrobiales bacterium]
MKQEAANTKARTGAGARLAGGGLTAVAMAAALIGGALPAEAAGVTWTPKAVPASLPPDPLAQAAAISCTATGDCSAGGSFVDSSGDQQALVFGESSGKWAAAKMAGLPQPSATGSLLDSVSCASPGDCSAVGDYVTSAGQFGLLVNESGGTWGKGVTVKLPGGAGSTPYATVLAVSCTATGDCSAVGDDDDNGVEEGLLLTETSGTWGTGVAVVPPDGGRVVFLYDVSCSSPGDCGAVGTYLDGSGNTQPMVLSEQGGKWSGGVAATLPSGASPFQDVTLPSISCRSSGDCTAVGSYSDSAGNRQGLLLTETSGKWASGVKASLPGGAGSAPSVFMTSASCSAAGTCGAAGSYIDSSGARQALFLAESKGKWGAAVKGGLPKTAGTQPDASSTAVSCLAAGSCTASGVYLDTAGDEQGVVFTEKAGTWAPGVEAAKPAGGTSAYLTALSCTSAGNCVTGGGYVDGAGNSQVLTVIESSGKVGAGTEVTSPAGYPWRMMISAVSCGTTQSCVGVGEIDNGVAFSSNTPRAAIVDDSSGKWTMLSPDLPGGANDADLSAVSCPSAGNCSAIGMSDSGLGVISAVLVDETAGKWTAGIKASLPAGGDSPLLDGISCASAGNCVAVGQYYEPEPVAGHGLIVTETAGKWATGTTAALSAGIAASGVNITAVACPTVGNCSAVGEYTTSSDAQLGLLLSETGGKWAPAVEASTPGSSSPTPEVTMSALSCPSAGNCSAVGTYFDSDGNSQAVTFTSTAGKWAAGKGVTLPKGAPSVTDSSLGSVSCRTAGNCTAVGAYFDGSSHQQGLLVSETAGKWSTALEAPVPAGAFSDPLVTVAAVSCSAVGDCSAVGRYADSPTDTAGLLLTEASGKWSAVSAPLPPGAATVAAPTMASVSCPATAACDGVGTYQSASGSALVETSAP